MLKTKFSRKGFNDLNEILLSAESIPFKGSKILKGLGKCKIHLFKADQPG